MSDSDSEELQYPEYQKYFEQGSVSMTYTNFECDNGYYTKYGHEFDCGNYLDINKFNDYLHKFNSNLACYKGDKFWAVFLVCSDICKLKLELDIYDIDPTAIEKTEDSLINEKKICHHCAQIFRSL